MLETLEARHMLASIVWDGGGDGTSWHDPLNWSTDALPTENDDVVADAQGAAIQLTTGAHAARSVDLAGTFLLSGGGLSIAEPSAIRGSFTLAGGTLAVSSDVTVTDAFQWTGGEIAGTGQMIVADSAVLTIGGRGELSGTVTNHGLATYQSGDIRFRSGGTFDNAGVLDLQADGDLFVSYTGLGNTFHNRGTLVKSAGPGMTTIGVSAHNSGVVEVHAGTLQLGGGGDSTGSYEAGAGATLRFGRGAHRLTGGRITGAGTANFFDSPSSAHFIELDETSTYAVALTRVEGGDVRFHNAASTAVLDLSSGAVGGAGTLEVADALQWTGGEIGGTGQTIVADTATLTIGGRGELSGTVTNHGLAIYQSGDIRFRSGGIFDNAGVLDLQADGDLLVSWTGLGNTFHNRGTLVKSAGDDVTTISVSADNSGVVEVHAGTLRFTGGGDSTGSYEVRAGATLGFGRGAHRLTGGRITGAGTANFFDSRSSAEFVELDETSTYAVALTRVDGGDVRFHNAASTGALDLSSGAAGGAGTLEVTGALSWTGGTMSGTGTTRALGRLEIRGANTKTLMERTLDNAGEAVWSGDGDIRFRQAAVFNNLAGARFEVRNDRQLSWYAGTNSTFNNAGRYIKSAGSGTTTSNIVFNNTGAVVIQTGTLLSSQGMTFDGDAWLAIDPSAALVLAGDLTGSTSLAALHAPLGRVRLQGFGTRTLEVMSRDAGNVASGYTSNFALGTLELANGTNVQLVDHADNAAGLGREAVYVNRLVVPAASTLDLNGHNLYARDVHIDGNVINGVINPPADGGPVSLAQPLPGQILAPGEVDEWTFYGRAGRSVSVVVHSGAEVEPSPLPPALNWVQVQVVGPDGSVLATADNVASGSGAPVSLQGVRLPADGIYQIHVGAPAAQGGATGRYILTAYDSTGRTAPLPWNQTVTGTIAARYAVDRWTFSAASNTQVRFDLVNRSTSGIVFTLTDPQGNAVFTDADSDTARLNLSSGGEYVLTVRGLGTATGDYAFQLEQTSLFDLPLATLTTGTLAGSGAVVLYRIESPGDTSLLVSLDHSRDSDRTELYLRRGAPPTRGVYDYRYTAPNAADHTILVPRASAGEWYVSVYGDHVPEAAGFALRATASNVFVDAATPDAHATDASATLTVAGAGFMPGVLVELVSAAATVPVASIEVDSFTQLTAELDLAGVPEGTYAIRVSEPGGTWDVLPDAFRVLPAGAAALETRLIMPASFGRHALATIYVEYANTGTAAMPAPLLVLQNADPEDVNKPILTLDQSRLIPNFWSSPDRLPPGTAHRAMILAGGAQPGVLNPGERIQVPVYYLGLQRPWDFSARDLRMEIRYWTADDAAPIDWSEGGESLRPQTIHPDAWEAIFAHLTQDLATVGDYVQMLGENAAYLGRLGEQVVDVGQLWNFEVLQAYGFTAVASLDSAVDAALPVPGLSLSISREFAASLDSRFVEGPFGRGWHTPWQVRLESEAGGELVRLIGSSGSLRTFQRDTRYGSYFSQNGDPLQLTAVENGAFELSVPGGPITRFDSEGRIQSIRDSHGHRLTPTYDAGGRMSRLEHSSGASLAIAYNAFGRIESIVDSAGRRTAYRYDDTGQYLEQVTYDDGTITRYTYETAGGPALRHALLSVQAAGVTRHFGYDARGRLDRVSLDNDVHALDFDYGPGGLVRIDDGLGTTSLYFDHRGLLAKTADPLGHVSTFEHDRDLRLRRIVLPTGDSQSFTWTSGGRPSSITDARGQTTRFEYDAQQRLLSTTDARGHVTRHTYDAGGNLLATVFPDQSVERYASYNAGLPGSHINRRGQAIGYTYNSSGQITRQTFEDGTAVDLAYDLRGNLTRVTDATGVTTYTYDHAADGDRIQRIEDPNGRSLTYSYDSFGRRIGMTDQDGNATRYEYDEAGRLSRLLDGADAVLVSYTYDATGRLARVDKGNGTFTTYQYDAAGQLLHLVHHRDAATINSRFDYTYDALGRRTGVSSLDGTWTYHHDPAGQLTRAVFVSANPAVEDQDLQYVYDAVGNRVRTLVNGESTEYVTNALNQYTSVGGVGYRYDADGNLTSDGVNSYAYDPQNRLVRITGPAGVIEYEHDAFGSRTARIVNGQRTEYLLDPSGLGNAVAEYSDAGTLQAGNVYGLGLVARLAGASELSYFDFDAIGSTVGVSDTSGAYHNAYVYAPFGGMLWSQGPGDNPFQFIGQAGLTAEGDGLTFMRARHYVADAGRFLSADPLGLGGGDVNLYRYVQNAPVSFVDPSGLRAKIGGKVGGGLDAVLEVPEIVADQLCVNPYQGDYRRTGRAVGRIAGGVGGGWAAGTAASAGTAAVLASVGVAATGPVGWFVAGVGVFAGFVGGQLGAAALGGTGEWVGSRVADPRAQSPEVFLNHLCDQSYQPVQTWVPSSAGMPGSVGGTGVANAVDPNEKRGPAGHGEANFVSADSMLPYRIEFENYGPGSVEHDGTPAPPERWATAPAQKVEIVDELSPWLDWDSFRFTGFGFGDHTVALPAATTQFVTVVPVSYGGRAFDVHVSAALERATGIVRIVLQSIDPSTSLPPDVLTGFLPPEDGTGRGRGYVEYTIAASRGLPTGTAIRNVAQIIFDDQQVIATNQIDPLDPAKGTDPGMEALVTLDEMPPTSGVAELPGTVGARFDVSWAGSDDPGGSGIATYDIYVSVDHGPFQPWRTVPFTITSAKYDGQPESSYTFYSLATDHVGHRQAVPAGFQSTRVGANPWHNYAHPWDVNGDGMSTPQDVLLLINWINDHPDDPALPASPASGPPYWDVNDDSVITPVDVLMVINDINARAADAPEGEATIRSAAFQAEGRTVTARRSARLTSDLQRIHPPRVPSDSARPRPTHPRSAPADVRRGVDEWLAVAGDHVLAQLQPLLPEFAEEVAKVRR